MAVQVNPVRDDSAEKNISLLGAAIGVAKDLFKVKMDDKAQARAEGIKMAQLEAEQKKYQAEQASKGEARDVEFAEKFLPVPEGTKGALSLPGRQGLFLPRADMRAQEANAAQIAGRNIDNQNKQSEQNFRKTQDLSNDYNKDSKLTVESVDAFKKLEAAARNPNPTGVTDIALVTQYIKTLDPTSTVREGEFANAENAPGVSARALNMYNKVLNGERLTPESRLNFLEEAKRSVQTRLVQQAQVDELYTNKANNFKVDPRFVVNPNFSALRQELGELKMSGGGGNTDIVKLPGGASVSRQQILDELAKRQRGTVSR